MKASSSDDNSIVSVQYCTGYVDKQNGWRPGFNCSAQISKQQNSTPLFCCGTSNHKYCCSTKQYIQLGYAGGHNNDVTYGTLLTVVLSTFIFSVMLTIIAFVCCKRFWKSRENLNLELADDQLYRNTNFLTLNATQLINAHSYGANGLPVQTDAIQSTPTSSMNALPQQQTLLSPSIQPNNLVNNNSINNSLPAIVTSMSPIASNQQQPLTSLYTSASSAQPYAISQPTTTMNAQQMNTSMNAAVSGQSSIAMTGYSVHPQAIQQALIFYEPPPPYHSHLEISNEVHHRAYPSNNDTAASTTVNNLQQQQINGSMMVSTTAAPTNSSNLTTATSNIDLNTINLISNQASASYQSATNQSNDDRPTNNTNDLPTNIWSQRLLLALGNYRRDCVYPVLDQPRKKLCRTLSQ